MENLTNAENNINMLVNILSDQGKSKEADQIALLKDQIKSMEENYLSVFQELQDIKIQMNEMRNELQNVNGIKKQFEGHAESTKKQYGMLQSIKDDLNRKSGEIVQRFQNFGVKALNNVCAFLGVKETLVKLRDMSQSHAVEMAQAVENVEAVGEEAKLALLHAKNVGKVRKGEEKIAPESVEPPKIFQKLKQHYEKRTERFEKRTDTLNKSIEKFTMLEKTADKASVRAKIADNKAIITAKDAAEPKAPAHQQEAAYVR